MLMSIGPVLINLDAVEYFAGEQAVPWHVVSCHCSFWLFGGWSFGDCSPTSLPTPFKALPLFTYSLLRWPRHGLATATEWLHLRSSWCLKWIFFPQKGGSAKWVFSYKLIVCLNGYCKWVFFPMFLFKWKSTRNGYLLSKWMLFPKKRFLSSVIHEMKHTSVILQRYVVYISPPIH